MILAIGKYCFRSVDRHRSRICLRGYKKEAFSLVEMLVAIAVLSIGIITIMQAISFSGRVAGLSSDIINAVFLAQDKMQEWEFEEGRGLIKGELLNTEGKSGKFDWKSTLSLEPDSTLYNLKLDIAWQRFKRQEKFDLNTYLR